MLAVLADDQVPGARFPRTVDMVGMVTPDDEAARLLTSRRREVARWVVAEPGSNAGGRLSATGVDRGEVLRRLRDFANHWSL